MKEWSWIGCRGLGLLAVLGLLMGTAIVAESNPSKVSRQNTAERNQEIAALATASDRAAYADSLWSETEFGGIYYEDSSYGDDGVLVIMLNDEADAAVLKDIEDVRVRPFTYTVAQLTQGMRDLWAYADVLNLQSITYSTPENRLTVHVGQGVSSEEVLEVARDIGLDEGMLQLRLNQSANQGQRVPLIMA